MTNITTAANLAVIELLVAPEFDNEFVIELMEKAGIDTTDENIEKVVIELLEINKKLAAPIIAALPENLRADYEV